MFCCNKHTLSNSVALQILKVIKRNIVFKYKKQEPKTCCDLALSHFDVFYKLILKEKWPSVRLGLLSSEKMVAVINNFVDVNKTENMLEEQGAFNLKSFMEVQKKHLVIASTENNTNQSKQEDELSNAICEKKLEIEDAEVNEIYSSNKDVQSKARFSDNDEGGGANYSTTNDEYFYDPEDTMTSLRYDVSQSELDHSRLILSDSGESSLHEFVPVTKLRSTTEYIAESEFYKFYKPKTEHKIDIQQEEDFTFPENLKVYFFPRGDFTKFPDPIRNENDIYNYHIMNGADLLPVLALDVQPGEAVLDMVPNLGNPAYCIFQSLNPKLLVCNSNSATELLFSKYLYDYSPTWKNMLLLTKINPTDPENVNLFDKVLLDVTCTNDRLSITDKKNNYFAVRNKKERLKLPEKQLFFLSRALNMVRPGGTVVYTTTTMCPIQNDGVIAETLRLLMNESQMTFCVKDMSNTLMHTEYFFRYAKSVGLKFGTLVLPFLPSNFGPRYIAKIVRLS